MMEAEKQASPQFKLKRGKQAPQHKCGGIFKTLHRCATLPTPVASYSHHPTTSILPTKASCVPYDLSEASRIGLFFFFVSYLISTSQLRTSGIQTLVARAAALIDFFYRNGGTNSNLTA